MPSEVEDLPVMPEHSSGALWNRVALVVVEDVLDDGVKVKQFNEEKQRQESLPFWLDELPVVSV